MRKISCLLLLIITSFSQYKLSAQLKFDAGIIAASGYTRNTKTQGIMNTRGLFVYDTTPMEMGVYFQTNFTKQIAGSVELSYAYIKFTDYYFDTKKFNEDNATNDQFVWETFRQIDVPVSFIKVPLKLNYNLLSHLYVNVGLGTDFLITSLMQRNVELYSTFGMAFKTSKFGVDLSLEGTLQDNAFKKTEEMLEWHLIRNPSYWFNRRYLKLSIYYKLWSIGKGKK